VLSLLLSIIIPPFLHVLSSNIRGRGSGPITGHSSITLILSSSCKGTVVTDIKRKVNNRIWQPNCNQSPEHVSTVNSRGKCRPTNRQWRLGKGGVGVEVQLYSLFNLGCFTPGKETRYPLYRWRGPIWTSVENINTPPPPPAGGDTNWAISANDIQYITLYNRQCMCYVYECGFKTGTRIQYQRIPRKICGGKCGTENAVIPAASHLRHLIIAGCYYRPISGSNLTPHLQ
jgi:hypothetical protein